MFIRRLAASACALGLIIPAAAGAQQADHIFPQPAPEKTHTVYGDSHYDLQNKQELGVTAGTKGDLKASVAAGKTVGHVDSVAAAQFASSGAIRGGPAPSIVDRIGSLSAKQLAAAYGTERPKVTPIATPASSATQNNDDDGWRVAAIAEAGLLAAFLAGCGVALSRVRPRRRAPGLGV